MRLPMNLWLDVPTPPGQRGGCERYARRIRRLPGPLVIAVMLTVTLSGCAAHVRRDLSAYEQATISVLTRQGDPALYDVLLIDDPVQLRQLASHFEAIERLPYTRPAGQQAAQVVIHFEAPGEPIYRITTDYETWSWGEGPLPVRGDLQGFINHLRATVQ